MKLLVLGSKGQLGRCLGDQLANTDHDVVYASRDQIDITDFHNTNLIIKDINKQAQQVGDSYEKIESYKENDFEDAYFTEEMEALGISDIILRAVTSDPEERYQNTLEMAEGFVSVFLNCLCEPPSNDSNARMCTICAW